MHDATKTTLSDPLESENKPTLRERLGVAMGSIPLEHPLVANSTDEIIPFEETPTLTPPRVGEYWPGQGGYYAGIIRDGDRQWHLLLASELIEVTSMDSPQAEFIRNASQPVIAAWGDYGTELAGEFSQRDGMHNTYLILASDSENQIASHCTALLIDGHKDFYWPSQRELSLLHANLPEHFEKTWHWSSSQFSARHAWAQDFEFGTQYFGSKDDKLAAQAVRRILID